MCVRERESVCVLCIRSEIGQHTCMRLFRFGGLVGPVCIFCCGEQDTFFLAFVRLFVSS